MLSRTDRNCAGGVQVGGNMALWLLLFFGLIAYYILRRSVSRITRTPVWMLWLVMMAPAGILIVWAIARGNERPPLLLAAGPFLVCFVLYWYLVQRGRIPPQPSPPSPPEGTPEAKDPPSLRPIDANEEVQLRDCFPWTVYALRQLEYRPQAVICRGQLRTNPEDAYQTVRDKVHRLFGDRFLLVFHEGMVGKPFFVLVPNPQGNVPPTHNSLDRPGLALALLFITLFTTTYIGAELAGIPADNLRSNPQLLLSGLAYSLPLLGIIGIHELGHYLAAKFHKVRVTLPYFIPFPLFLGTFGAFVQIRSPMPNRRALFDISIAGPLAGFLATLPILVWGLAHSQVVPATEDAGIVTLDALRPTFSFLLSLLSKLSLGDAIGSDKAIDLHPAAISGYLGLILTAFNLMPIGQLDGGRIVHAMLGKHNALAIGQIARLLMLVLAAIHPELLLWAILLFLMPVRDEPALNDVSDLDDRRDLSRLVVPRSTHCNFAPRSRYNCFYFRHLIVDSG